MRLPCLALMITLLSMPLTSRCLAHPEGHHHHANAAVPAASPPAGTLAQNNRRRSSPPSDTRSRTEATTAIAAAFAPFVARGEIQTRSDRDTFFVESRGIPHHPLMVGITAWQQQVPLPQAYVGENAWQIPLHPVPADKPQTTKNAFLRGAIAVAVNGIPIFNPLNNRGEDAFLIGELDHFGGHCGRADDYHYHIAPVHLQKIVGNAQPIAYALDGYAIYGYREPDGSAVKNLDACNGHIGPAGDYHYHATPQYPYLNGGFHGEVVERDGQVDPQPRARPIRPALPPLRGATITSYESDGNSQAKLTYQIGSQPGAVAYRQTADGSLVFTFTSPDGTSRTETYRQPRSSAGNTTPAKPEKRKQSSETKKREKKTRGGNRDAKQPRPTAGERTFGENQQTALPDSGGLRVTSQSCSATGRLLTACTCDGAGVSPAVAWSGLPSGTRSVAISLWHTAPDQEKSYWVVTHIPPSTSSLPQGVRLPTGTSSGPVLGRNDRGRQAYEPPCSQGPGLKTYHLTVYALSEVPDRSPQGATRPELLETIMPITLATGTLDLQVERTPQ